MIRLTGWFGRLLQVDRGDQHSLELVVVTQRDTMLQMREGHTYSGALDTAPLVLVVAANHAGAIYPELLEFDAGIATHAVLVQAGELGLSTVVMSVAPSQSESGRCRALWACRSTLSRK